MRIPAFHNNTLENLILDIISLIITNVHIQIERAAISAAHKTFGLLL